MKKNDKDNKAIATKTPDEIDGRPVMKSGSAYASTPPKNAKNPVAFDYASMKYKSYPNKINVFIDENEERFPSESKVPPYKKYDKDGKYIKGNFIATQNKNTSGSSDKESKSTKSFGYSIGKLSREGAQSLPTKNKNVRRK